MRLLVTRPAGDAELTAARLEALGHEAMIAPMLERVLLPLPPIDELPGAIALTSANALAGIEASPQSRQWRHIPVFSVGGRTAEAAREAGYVDVRSADGDSSDLVRLIEATLTPTIGTILYPAATERSGHVDTALRSAGFGVHLAEVYRMQPIESLPDIVRASLSAGRLSGVLLYSRRTAETFVRLAQSAGLEDALRGTTGFALSPTIAAGLPFGRIVTAAEPNEDALLDVLKDGGGTSAAGKC